MANPLIRAAAWGLARLARYQPVQNGLRKLARAYQQEQTVTAVATATAHDIPEVTSLVPRMAPVQGGTRLNLLVPALSERHVFGGIATALQVFDALRPYFDEARIIVTDEATPEPRADAYYGHWPIVPMAGDAATTEAMKKPEPVQTHSTLAERAARGPHAAPAAKPRP